MYDHLLSPLTLGRVTLPNRICFLAHRTNFARRGLLDDRHVAYYRRRAQGGCGLIIVGELSIHPNDRPWEAMIEAYRAEVVKDYKRLTAAVHEFETPIFAQLNHHGFQSSGAISRHAIWGPSALSDIAFGEIAKPMEIEDMGVMVDAFAHAAVLAREGGFDGLEIDMGPESLLRQFLSPLSNLRQDEYGVLWKTGCACRWRSLMGSASPLERTLQWEFVCVRMRSSGVQSPLMNQRSLPGNLRKPDKLTTSTVR